MVFCYVCNRGITHLLKGHSFCSDCIKTILELEDDTLEELGIDDLTYDERRRLRIKENGGSHTMHQWVEPQKEYGYRCIVCGIHRSHTPEGYLTRDHSIPIVKGGSDDISNIKPMCLKCNFRKGIRTMEQFLSSIDRNL